MSEIVRNVLTMREQFALAAVLKESFTKSGLSQEDFAEYVNNREDLRKEYRFTIKKGHIAHMCEALDIPSNMRKKTEVDHKDMLSLTARVVDLELQVGRLCNHIKMLEKDLRQ